MTTNIALAAFKASGTGVTTSRTLAVRWADVINVLDFGADPTGGAPCDTQIQAALDAAFTTGGTPNGLANASKNRPVFFPNGSYKLGATLNLVRIVGGHIFGAATGSTILLPQTSAPAITINGAANLVVERIQMLGNNANSPMLDLGWDNTSGGDGLHNNVFREILMANLADGIFIAKQGNDGANNLFEMCSIKGQGTGTGIEARGANAVNNVWISGGPTGFAQGFYCSGGSIHAFEGSLAGNTYDMRVDSGFPVAVIGGRTESSNTGQAFLKLTSGLVTVRGFIQVSGTGGHDLANITGGKATFDGCNSPYVFSGTGGTVYLRGNTFPGMPAPPATTGFTGYTNTGGTVAQNI